MDIYQYFWKESSSNVSNCDVMGKSIQCQGKNDHTQFCSSTEFNTLQRVVWRILQTILK